MYKHITYFCPSEAHKREISFWFNAEFFVWGPTLFSMIVLYLVFLSCFCGLLFCGESQTIIVPLQQLSKCCIICVGILVQVSQHNTCWCHWSPNKLQWQSAFSPLPSPEPCTSTKQCPLTPQCCKHGVPHRIVPERTGWCHQFQRWRQANKCTWSKIWKM